MTMTPNQALRAVTIARERRDAAQVRLDQATLAAYHTNGVDVQSILTASGRSRSDFYRFLEAVRPPTVNPRMVVPAEFRMDWEDR
jgi:hypothetical protein